MWEPEPLPEQDGPRLIQPLARQLSARELVRGRLSGQISTMLLLMIAVGLIFTLALANLGRLSMNATTLDNAADQASLMLATQLGGKSHQLWEGLGRKTKKCQPSGFLAILIAVVLIIVAIIITIVTWGGGSAIWAVVIGALGAVGVTGTAALAATLIVVAALAGAVGGAIGGAIDGSGAGRGALMGAGLGAAIGGAVGGGLLLGPALFGSAGAAASGGVAAVPCTTGALGSSLATAGMVSAIAAPAFGAIAVGSAIYNHVAAVQMTSDAMSAAARATQGLTERSRMREGVVLYSLAQTVDDPNLTNGACFWPQRHASIQDAYGGSQGDPAVVPVRGDPLDSDGDGDLTEEIPCFQFWWDQRMRQLKNDLIGRVALPASVGQFVRGGYRPTSMAAFANRARNWYRPRGLLAREEIEGTRMPLPSECGNCNGDQDGSVVKLARALYASGIPSIRPRFWRPGPTKLQMTNFVNRDTCGDETFTCPGNPAPAGIDDLDGLNQEVRSFVEMADELRVQSPDYVASTVDQWLPLIYDPDRTDSDSYYVTMDNVRDDRGRQVGWKSVLTSWQTELNSIRRRLPACDCVWNGTTCRRANNPPCRWTRGATIVGTIDANPNDDFTAVLAAIDTTKRDIDLFRQASHAFYTDVNGAQEQAGNLWGGNGRITYRWKDSRGNHSVGVDISDFPIPKFKKKKNFFKTCIVLKNHSDDGRKTWVRLTRNDPMPFIGSLWEWGAGSPFGGSVSRRSMAQWSYNSVQLHPMTSEAMRR